MKKTLLFAAAACLSLSAMAATPLQTKKLEASLGTSLNSRIEKVAQAHELKTMQPRKARAAEQGPIIAEFPGETTLYSMEAYPEGYYDCDMAVKIQFDGSDVYISGLIPGLFSEDVVLKGTVEGNTITIPSQKIYNLYDYFGYYLFDLYISKLVMNENGEIIVTEDGYPAFLEEPYTLTINEDGSIVDPELARTDEGIVASFLGVFVDGVDYGFSDREFFTYNAGMTLVPYTGPEAVTLPEGAQTEEYTYAYTRGGANFNEIAQAYVDGNDVYLQGITFGSGAWVKGTITDGKLVVPSGQFLGDNVSVLYLIEAVTNFVLDDEGYIESFEELDALTFSIAEDGSFILDEGQNVGLVYYQSQILGAYMSDVKISKFEGFKAAIPATPQLMEFADYLSAYGQYYLGIQIPTVGTKGEMLDINNLEWAIYADEEVYEFSADDDYLLSEPMTWFPAAGFLDNGGGYDISCSNGTVVLYLYAGLYSEIGMQSRYHFGDKTYYSNIFYIDPVPVDPEQGLYNVREVEVENEPIEDEDPVSINTVAAQKLQNLFDLQGRRAEKAAKGLVINNGKVDFVK